MKLWTRSAVAVALAGGLAVGVVGCRTEVSTLGQDAQVYTPQQGQGGAGEAGTQPPADEMGQGQVHGEGLGNVVDGHGYERSKEVGAADISLDAPTPVEPAPEPAPH